LEVVADRRRGGGAGLATGDDGDQVVDAAAQILSISAWWPMVASIGLAVETSAAMAPSFSMALVISNRDSTL
jgi:hypothetical protein